MSHFGAETAECQRRRRIKQVEAEVLIAEVILSNHHVAKVKLYLVYLLSN